MFWTISKHEYYDTCIIIQKKMFFPKFYLSSGKNSLKGCWPPGCEYCCPGVLFFCPCAILKYKVTIIPIKHIVKFDFTLIPFIIYWDTHYITVRNQKLETRIYCRSCTWINWSNIARCWSHQASVILFGSVQSCERGHLLFVFVYSKHLISTRLSFQYISLILKGVWNVRLIFHTAINAPDNTTDSYCADWYRVNELPICQWNLINLPTPLKLFSLSSPLSTF